MSSTSSLPPELVDRINRPNRSRFGGSMSKFETASGGFVPYSTVTRKSMGSSAYGGGSASVAHVSETSHWLTRNQVGQPEKTAWMINEKGTKVWFTFEHTPCLFPVKETRFYKPKLHRMDFLGKKKKDEAREI